MQRCNPDDDLSLTSKTVGALPIVNHILEQLRLDQILERFVPCSDKRLKLAPALGLGVPLANRSDRTRATLRRAQVG